MTKFKAAFIALFVGLVSTLALLNAATAPAQAADGSNKPVDRVERVSKDTMPTTMTKALARVEEANDCRHFVAFDFETEEYAVFSEVDYGVEIGFRNCAAPAAGVSRRTQVLYFTTLCRSDGPASDPNWAHFNLRFFDKDGHTYNPTYKSMECPDQNTWRERVYYSTSNQWFHKCAAGPPRWEAELKVDYPNPHGYDTAWLSGPFWGYDGSGNTNC